MSGGGCVGRVEGGRKNGRGGVNGEGSRGNGEEKGDEIRGVYNDPFQEKSHFLGRPMIDVNKVGEDGESCDDDRVDIHADIGEGRGVEGDGREERCTGRRDTGGRGLYTKPTLDHRGWSPSIRSLAADILRAIPPQPEGI